MKHVKLPLPSLLLLLFVFLASCEKITLNDEPGKNPSGSQQSGNACISIHIGGVGNTEYNNSETKCTRAIEPVQNVCSRMSISLYREDGTRVFCVNKKSTDADFCDVSMKVAEGKYSLLVVAHSNEKNAATTDLNKVTFDGKVSDTFHYFEKVELKAGDNPYNITLNRVTAMFRLEIIDEVPESARQLKFYYTGGSSTLDGATGYGCVNSKQTEVRDIVNGTNIFDIYTFPHADGRLLKVSVTALDASGNALCEQTFENVSVRRNVITHYRGKFFGSITPPTPSDDYDLNISVDTDWLEENVVDF